MNEVHDLIDVDIRYVPTFSQSDFKHGVRKASNIVAHMLNILDSFWLCKGNPYAALALATMSINSTALSAITVPGG